MNPFEKQFELENELRKIRVSNPPEKFEEDKNDPKFLDRVKRRIMKSKSDLQRKHQFQNIDGENKIRTDSELNHIKLRPFLTNLDSPGIWSQMLQLQNRIPNSHEIIQVLNQASDLDQILQKVVIGCDPDKYPKSAKILQYATVRSKFRYSRTFLKKLEN